jgi:hypothetical protein
MGLFYIRDSRIANILWRAHSKADRDTTLRLLEDSPHEVGDQSEYHNHETSNPNQESGG